MLHRPMASSGLQKLPTMKSKTGHNTKSDHDASKLTPRTNRSSDEELDNREVRKSGRKRTLKRFDNFYVDIISNDDRENDTEKTGTKRASRQSKSESASSYAVADNVGEREIQNKGGKNMHNNFESTQSVAGNDDTKRQNRERTKTRNNSKSVPSVLNNIGDTKVQNKGDRSKSVRSGVENAGSRKKTRKQGSKSQNSSESIQAGSDTSGDRKRRNKEDTISRNSSESAQLASSVLKTEDGQVRKSSRKRTLKCFDDSFIDDRLTPKKRQETGPKSSEPVKRESDTDTKCDRNIPDKEREPAQSSSVPQHANDGESQNIMKKNALREKAESAQPGNNVSECSVQKKQKKEKTDCSSHVHLKSESNSGLQNSQEVKKERKSESSQLDGNASNCSDKGEEIKEQNNSTKTEASEPENDPGLENSRIVKKRRKRSKNKIHSCEVCAKIFKKVADLDKHRLVHTGEKPFECDECGKRFTQCGNMKAHKLIHSGEKPFKCDKCDKAFARAGDLKSHRLTHNTDKPFACDICKKCFKTADYLKSHKEIHSDVRPFSCEECGKGFLKLAGLKAHKVIHTGIKAFCCRICSKSFYTAGNLKEHEFLHSGDRPFQCEICGFKFTKNSSLKKHMMLHSGKKPFICHDCGKGYTNKSEWEIHSRTHTGERPFECEHCQANFHRKANLMQHVSAVHLGIRPHLCHLCEKAFTEARCLKEHLLIHSGEKPHHCTLCGKAFTQLSTLKAHMRSHSGIKPYPCKYCEKPFSDISSRNRHHRIHTGEKPYKCVYCSTAFSRLELCKSHIQHEHKVEKPASSSAVSKQPSVDNSCDIPLTPSVAGQSVKADEDHHMKAVQFNVMAQSEPIEDQHVKSLRLGTQKYSDAEQFVITVTDGTQIILQTSGDNIPQISTVHDHLSIDHPYVVTSNVAPVENIGDSDASGLTVIELQVVDDKNLLAESELDQCNSVSDGVIVEQEVDLPSKAPLESLLGVSQDGSVNASSSVIAESQACLEAPAPVPIQIVSQGSASCLPITESHINDSNVANDASRFVTVKSELDTDHVSESIVLESQSHDMDSLGTVVVKSEVIDGVLSAPVILESEIAAGSDALTYAVVSSQAEGDMLTQTVVSQVDGLGEMSFMVVKESQAHEHDNINAVSDQSHVEQLAEDESIEISSEQLLDNHRTILRDLLTDPASGTTAQTGKSREDTSMINTGMGEVKMKKRRYASVPKSFFCEMCGLGFTQASSLKKHQILLHSEQKPFVCEICQKGCTSRSELEAHNRSHTGEKPFKCQHCGVALKRKANLEQHIRAVHMQHRPHRCDVCGRTFTEARSLKDHKLIHLGTKPHKCGFCGKAFTQLGTLKKHQNTHSGIKQYVCAICTKHFSDPTALRRHVRLHTGERPYKCEYCASAFFRSEQLKTHKRNEHPDNLDDLASIALATGF